MNEQTSMGCGPNTAHDAEKQSFGVLPLHVRSGGNFVRAHILIPVHGHGEIHHRRPALSGQH